MAVKICLGHILFSFYRQGIISCHDLFAVRVIDLNILAPAVAGISHRKMRSHLLRDQNRQLILDFIFLCRCIGSRVCSNGKLSQRKGRMFMEDIIADIFFSLLLFAAKKMWKLSKKD